jgi:hypothetical protein
MREVKSKEDFEYVFKASKVILFLDFKWSGYTSAVRPFIYEWIKKTEIIKAQNIEVFEFFPDGELDNIYSDWLEGYVKIGNKNGLRQLRYHGYGDIIWIESGEIRGGESLFELIDRRVDKTMAPYLFSQSILDEKTKEYLK